MTFPSKPLPSNPDPLIGSRRGEDLDYFGARPTCGCITAWLSAAYSTDEEVAEFARSMRETDRDVIRGTLEEYRDKLDQCPHWRAL